MRQYVASSSDTQIATNSFSASSAADPCVIDLSDLVERVRSGQQSGLSDLYSLFFRGVGYYLYRNVHTSELNDKIHDTFLIVVSAIRRGELRKPDRLLGFIRTIVRRQVAEVISRTIQTRTRHIDSDYLFLIPSTNPGPEQQATRNQRSAFVQSVLTLLSDRQREVLTRFYIQEQPFEEICNDMGITETQFRLLKSRAKARFGVVGRAALQWRNHQPDCSFGC